MIILLSTQGCVRSAQTSPAMENFCFLGQCSISGLFMLYWAKSALSSLPHSVPIFVFWNNCFFAYNTFSCHHLLSELLVIPQNPHQISPYLCIFVRFSRSIVPPSSLILWHFILVYVLTLTFLGIVICFHSYPPTRLWAPWSCLSLDPKDPAHCLAYSKAY